MDIAAPKFGLIQLRSHVGLRICGNRVVDLAGIGTEKGAAEACVFVMAICAVCASATAQAEFALHEMGFEFVPFGRRLVRDIRRWAE